MDVGLVPEQYVAFLPFRKSDWLVNPVVMWILALYERGNDRIIVWSQCCVAQQLLGPRLFFTHMKRNKFRETI